MDIQWTSTKLLRYLQQPGKKGLPKNPVNSWLSKYTEGCLHTRDAHVRLIVVFSVLYTYNIRSKAWCAAWVNVHESKHAGL